MIALSGRFLERRKIIRTKRNEEKRKVMSEIMSFGGGTFKIDFGVVKKEDFDLASVVGVDDARARVDEVFDCEPAAGGNAAIYSGMRSKS